jgi:hypothetical protein
MIIKNNYIIKHNYFIYAFRTYFYLVKIWANNGVVNDVANDVINDVANSVVNSVAIIYLITLNLFNLLGRFVCESMFDYVFDRSKE